LVNGGRAPGNNFVFPQVKAVSVLSVGTRSICGAGRHPEGCGGRKRHRRSVPPIGVPTPVCATWHVLLHPYGRADGEEAAQTRERPLIRVVISGPVSMVVLLVVVTLAGLPITNVVLR
jgi:hypothetical protein